MKKIFTCLLLFVSISAKAQLPTTPLNVDLIPKPVELKISSGYLTIDKSSPLYLDKQFASVSEYFQQELRAVTDITFEISKKAPKTDKAILVNYDASLSPEEYKLTIDGSNVKILASDNGGVVYALQTLRQLVRQNNPMWAHQYVFIPQLTISDKPSYGWRGYMLDVSRTFFSINQIKEMIDYMAQIKLNRLQLHLSDDQGFRVEMIKYPKLNTVGSWRVDHTNYDENDNSVWGRPVQKEGEVANYGGYYTREEIKDLVAYAKVRNIEILPEIDVPGHSQAIIAAYPEVSCEPDKKFYVATGAVMGNNTVCPSTEASYELIDAVISEVAELFPFEYIHIGGDECNKAQWARHDQCTHFKEEHRLKDDKELQSYFIKRVEKIVNSKGKKLIGWDEILEGGLAPNATVMSWRGTAGGVKSAQLGHDVIMSPTKNNYLDLKQGQALSEPNLGYMQALLSSAYNFVIASEELTTEEHKFILGTQANLWTETNSDLSKVKYMTFPRLMAVAENAWTPYEMKNWDDFIERLKSYMDIMDFEGVRHAKSVFNPWVHHVGNGKEVKFWFTSEITKPAIRYTLDGTDPKVTSELYTMGDTVTITATSTLKAAMFDGDKM
ncbi:MAG: family 20 glycosylhydrolase, partial [Rikenellaceae bacterium]